MVQQHHRKVPLQYCTTTISNVPANGISTYNIKDNAQEQKLKILLAEKRAATGKRSTLKKGLMPTLYTAGDNATANKKAITTTSLKAGRPGLNR